MRLKGEIIMTKKEFCRKYANEAGITIKEVEEIIYPALIKVIANAVDECDSVPLMGVGTLQGVMKKARKCMNPQTGKSFMVPEKKGMRFVPSKTFVKSLNED
jgi:DNA-binding protein HU-beta